MSLSSLAQFKKLQSLSNRSVTATQKQPDDFFYQLKISDKEATFVVVDKEGKELVPGKNIHALSFQGKDREILRFLETNQREANESLEWFEEEITEGLPFYRVEGIFSLLRNNERFVDQNKKAIEITNTLLFLVLEIKPRKNKFVSSLYLKENDEKHENCTILSQNYAWSNGKIYPINNLGDAHKSLSILETTFLANETNAFLSLFFSNFQNIHLDYEDLQVVERDPIEAHVSLIMEKVGFEQSLHVRIGQTISDFPPTFLDEMPVNKIARVEHEEGIISLQDLITFPVGEHYSNFKKTLKSVSKNLKDSDFGDFFEEENTFIIEKDLAQNLLEEKLSKIMDEFVLVGSEKLKEYKITTAQPTLSLQLNHGINFLEGTAKLIIEKEDFDLFEVMNQYKKNSYIQLSNGNKVLLNQSYLEKLKRLVKKDGDQIQISYFDLPAIEDLIDEKTNQEPFRKFREIFQGINDISKNQPVLPKLNATLRPYQTYGYAWLKYFHEHQMGACLADDMGLGKTLQAIALLSSIYPKEKKPTLIVMPKSLLYNWRREVEKFSPELKLYTYYEKNRDFKEAKKKHLILTTYGMVRNDIQEFQKQEFHYLVLDESQNIKSPNTQISKAVTLINTEHRLALSGTPIENNLFELYALFRFLNPGMFGSLNEFNRQYAIPIQKKGDPYATSELRQKTYPFILRRLKKNVLKDLPDKVEQTLYVEMTPEHKKLYEKRRVMYHEMISKKIEEEGAAKSQFFIFQALMELRQLATTPEQKSNGKIISPKREWIIQSISDAIANHHKVLVFSNFLDSITNLSEDLDQLGIEHLTMTGATRNRQDLVDEFQNNEKIKVFILSLKVGGTGLNLTAADMVYLLDPWWNSAAENQAIDRAHRIGQKNTVMSFKLITRDTIEEKIAELQSKKSELMDSLISADQSTIKLLDPQEIEYMFSQ